MEKKEEIKTVANNKKAFYDYHIMEKWEAGIALHGTEVKSIRNGSVNIKDAFAKVVNGEIYLMNAHISPYSHGNLNNHEPLRDRKLLLHKIEIERLIGKMAKKGFSLIPLSVYFKKGKIKVEIALGKGKKEYDRRADIKKKDIQREEARYDIKM
ncbi:MAG: SsrA-binding protein SmpB [bacterium]